jgi:ATP-dependent DNA ligase
MGDREQQPTFARPMLLTSGAVPDGDRWTLELRWDGGLAQIRYDGHSVSLRTHRPRMRAESLKSLPSLAW